MCGDGWDYGDADESAWDSGDCREWAGKRFERVAGDSASGMLFFLDMYKGRRFRLRLVELDLG